MAGLWGQGAPHRPGCWGTDEFLARTWGLFVIARWASADTAKPSSNLRCCSRNGGGGGIDSIQALAYARGLARLGNAS